MPRKKNDFGEIEYPKPDIEYWVVVDEELSMPHYFKNKESANRYAQHYGHTIIFQECFN